MLPPDDTATRAAAILEDIGETPSEPVRRAKVPAPNISPSLRERTSTVPIQVVAAMVGSGLLRPELLSLLGPVLLAPGVPVDASRLHWHAGLRALVYQCPNGSFAPLDRVTRLLLLGTDIAGAEGDDTALPGAPPGWALLVMADDRPRWQRFDRVLATTLYVYEQRVAGPDGTLVPTGSWIASTEYGEYRLVDLTPSFAPASPTFVSAQDAMLAAEAAILGEPFTRAPDIVDGVPNPYDPEHYYWVHNAVPEHLLHMPEVR